MGTKIRWFCLTVSLQQNRPHDDPQGLTYTQVTRSTSRPRQGMAASPSPLSEELLDTKGRQAEEDRQMDSQVGPVLSRPQASPTPTTFHPSHFPPAPGCCICCPPGCDLRPADPLGPQTGDKGTLRLPVRGTPKCAQFVCFSGHPVDKEGPRPQIPGRGPAGTPEGTGAAPKDTQLVTPVSLET